MRLFPLLLLTLLGWAGAQASGLPYGIPPELQPYLTVLIGLLTAVLVRASTAIAKKVGRTSGVTTVAVSAALSIVIALGFLIWQVWLTRSTQSFGTAFLVALIAFLKANGDYLVQVFANAKALREGTLTPPASLPYTPSLPDTSLPPLPEGEVLPPADVIGTPPGQEPPVLQQPTGGQEGGQVRGFLGAGLLTAGLGPLIELVLGEARLAPTTETVARVAAKLAQVAPDLLDGDLHINARNRAIVLGVVMDLKAKGHL